MYKILIMALLLISGTTAAAAALYIYALWVRSIGLTTVLLVVSGACYMLMVFIPFLPLTEKEAHPRFEVAPNETEPAMLEQYKEVVNG